MCSPPGWPASRCPSPRRPSGSPACSRAAATPTTSARRSGTRHGCGPGTTRGSATAPARSAASRRTRTPRRCGRGRCVTPTAASSTPSSRTACPAALLASAAAILLCLALLTIARTRVTGRLQVLETRLATGTLGVLVVAATHLTTDYALRNLAVMITVWFWVGLAWGQAVPGAPAAPEELEEPEAVEPVVRPVRRPVPAAVRRPARLAPSAGSAALSGVGAMVSAGANLLLLVVVARGLGVAATGVFSVCVAAGLVCLADLEVGPGHRGHPRRPAARRPRRLQPAPLARGLHGAAGSRCWAWHWPSCSTARRRGWPTSCSPTPAATSRRLSVAVAWSVPAAAPSLVLLSVLRARQSLRPLVVWDQVTKPVLRLVAVAGVVVLGGDVVTAVWAWALVQWVVLAGSLWEARIAPRPGWPADVTDPARDAVPLQPAALGLLDRRDGRHARRHPRDRAVRHRHPGRSAQRGHPGRRCRAAGAPGRPARPGPPDLRGAGPSRRSSPPSGCTWSPPAGSSSSPGRRTSCSDRRAGADGLVRPGVRTGVAGAQRAGRRGPGLGRGRQRADRPADERPRRRVPRRLRGVGRASTRSSPSAWCTRRASSASPSAPPRPPCWRTWSSPGWSRGTSASGRSARLSPPRCAAWRPTSPSSCSRTVLVPGLLGVVLAAVVAGVAHVELTWRSRTAFRPPEHDAAPLPVRTLSRIGALA